MQNVPPTKKKLRTTVSERYNESGSYQMIIQRDAGCVRSLLKKQFHASLGNETSNSKHHSNKLEYIESENKKYLCMRSLKMSGAKIF